MPHHDADTVRTALELVASGLSDREAAKRAGVSRHTLRRWRVGRVSIAEREDRDERRTRPLDERAYSYLLGVYLGDGVVSWTARSTQLTLTLDSRYPDVVRECAMAIARTLPVQVGWRTPAGRRMVILTAGSLDWPSLFPQVGPGKKHQRRIELVPWQLVITHQHTREFIRGLIHSDGSRCLNRFSVNLPSGRVGRYEYPRYFFTNYSADIRRIFCDHCDLLGIRWTQSNPRNISVSHRDSVPILDSFVGPKS
jgi:hypothetical protein